MVRVEALYDQEQRALQLQLVAGQEGLKRKITVPEAQRPGLALSGYLQGYAHKRILIFGKVELEYLRDLESSQCKRRLRPLITEATPAIIVTRRYRPPAELLALCDELQIPLFRSRLKTTALFNQLSSIFLLRGRLITAPLWRSLVLVF